MTMIHATCQQPTELGLQRETLSVAHCLTTAQSHLPYSSYHRRHHRRQSPLSFELILFRPDPRQLVQMTTTTLLPVRTHHLSPSNQFIKKRSFLPPPPPPPPTLLSQPRLLSLHRNGLLARAEDKTRDGSSSTQKQTQPNSSNQFQVLV